MGIALSAFLFARRASLRWAFEKESDRGGPFELFLSCRIFSKYGRRSPMDFISWLLRFLIHFPFVDSVRLLLSVSNVIRVRPRCSLQTVLLFKPNPSIKGFPLCPNNPPSTDFFPRIVGVHLIFGVIFDLWKRLLSLLRGPQHVQLTISFLPCGCALAAPLFPNLVFLLSRCLLFTENKASPSILSFSPM